MEIEQSSLYPQIQTIFNGGSNPVHFVYKAVIHVMSRNLDFPALKVVEIDTTSDHEVNFSDETMIKLSVSAGTYGNQVYPFRDYLEMTVTAYPLMETGDVPDPSQQPIVTRYQATLVDTGDPQIHSNGMNTPSQEGLDLSNLIEVEFQLIDKMLEQLRMSATGGVHRIAQVGDVLKAQLSNVGQSAQVDQKLKLKGVDMVPASNQNQRDHVIIPHGLSLQDLPEWLHQKCGGIYSAGLGSYLKKGFWYIYPCYDTTRLATSKDKITVILVPTNRFPNIERTYMQKGDNIVIVATGSVQFRGDSTKQQLNHGNGTRFMDAEKVLEGWITTNNNKALAARGNIINEFVSTPRPNGLNNVQMAKDPISANPFSQSSDLTRRQGSVVACVWENSNPDLLKPSTMANILYLANDTVQSLSGVLSKAQTHTAMSGIGMTNGRHVSRTAMSFFVQNPAS